MSTALPFASNAITIGNATIPPEGPKCLPFQFDFSTEPSYQIDISQLYSQSLISRIQVLWIDASLCGDMSIFVSGTSQQLKIEAGSQGYYPVISPANGVFTVAGVPGTGVDPGSAQMFLLNVPMSVLQWSPNGDGPSFMFDNAGNLRTADQGLAPLLTPDGLKVVESGGGGSTAVPATVQLAKSYTNSSGAELIGPGPGMQLVITKIQCILTGDAWAAGGPDLEIDFNDSGSGNPYFKLFLALPTVAPATPGPNQIVLDVETEVAGPVNYNAGEFVFSTPLSGGKLAVLIYGYAIATP
jgi:hypothetical protein